jgi:nucleoside-triphosphatase THEP1
MTRLVASAPITAILYSDGREVDPVMTRLAAQMGEAGLTLAGFVQRNEPREDRRRCDMVLVELASGVSIGISQDRGPLARGCHLDLGELLRGMELARAALASSPDLMIVNKFGKSEGEGGGFRPLMAEAVMAGVPLLVAVPWRNIDGWRLFAGDLAREIPLEEVTAAPDMLAQLGFRLGGEVSAPASLTPRQAGPAH